MSQPANYLPDEIVHLNGKGPMTLAEAVSLVMSTRRGGSLAGAAAKPSEPIIYRKPRKKPWALELSDIERLAARPEFCADAQEERAKRLRRRYRAQSHYI